MKKQYISVVPLLFQLSTKPIHLFTLRRSHWLDL